ncbi:TetR/AcrR family transcriptional regulator [Kordiimonas sp. SCSIO 12610]|uniref:TetR/AcrR family transcriptional regulator n=1 Tax=Kordiimonas sp. SCSIO 12610 TaxID=2829597 RepID=UPI00210BF47D|nr:TetR/AcrR family transcriptional regulator [Kordiimonas sp. SCSIO 12610]UTW54526.1 TetR/AcrR family transcriptional regulator [Kordiimonas sp. SCSIO 12610]
MENTIKRMRLSPEERRQQLLDIAVTLFAEKGIGEARHADIAARAHVSVATTFVYFPTREALVETVLNEVAEAHISLFDSIDPEGLSLNELLHGLAKMIVLMVSERPDYVKVWIGWSANFSKELRDKFLQSEAIAVDRLASILLEANSSSEMRSRDNARILLAASQTLSTMKLDGFDDERIQRFIDHTIDVVIAYDG